MREFSSQNHNGHRAIQVAISLLHLDELERGILVIIRAFYVRSPTCLLCCLDRKCTLCNQAFFFPCKCRCVSLRRPWQWSFVAQTSVFSNLLGCDTIWCVPVVTSSTKRWFLSLSLSLFCFFLTFSETQKKEEKLELKNSFCAFLPCHYIPLTAICYQFRCLSLFHNI